jgi:RNA methyltransferase, TrmH family
LTIDFIFIKFDPDNYRDFFMLTKAQIKYINSLKIKKYRHLHNSFIVEGNKGVSELMKSGFNIEMIVATSEWLDAAKPVPESDKTKIILVESTELGKISDLISPNQVLAVVYKPVQGYPPVSDLHWPILALDGIRDPGNLGTIIRTADWFGIRQVVCSPDCVDAYNPKTIMSTMGSFTRVAIYICNLAEYINKLDKNIPVLGAMLEGDDLTNVSFSKPGILIIGSESHGISENLKPLLTKKIYIPSYGAISSETGEAESLNASIANAIICYELTKQLLK